MSQFAAYKGPVEGFNPWRYVSEADRLAAERSMIEQGGPAAWRGLGRGDPRAPLAEMTDPIAHQQNVYGRWLEKQQQDALQMGPTVGAAAATALDFMPGPGEAFPFMPGGLAAVYGKKMSDLVDPKFREAYERGSKEAEDTLLKPIGPYAALKGSGKLDIYDKPEWTPPKKARDPNPAMDLLNTPSSKIWGKSFAKRRYGGDSDKFAQIYSRMFDEVYDSDFNIKFKRKPKPALSKSELMDQNEKLNFAAWIELEANQDDYWELLAYEARRIVEKRLKTPGANKISTPKDPDRIDAYEAADQLGRISDFYSDNPKEANKFAERISRILKRNNPDIDEDTAKEIAERMRWEFEYSMDYAPTVYRKMSDRLKHSVGKDDFPTMFEKYFRDGRKISDRDAGDIELGVQKEGKIK